MIHELRSTYFYCISLLSVYTCAVSVAVSVDGSLLYMTSYSHHRLLTLSMDGTVLSSLKDPALLGPAGVHLSETGQLLVCGHHAHNVVHVDGEGRVVTLASKTDGLNGSWIVY
ncbi:hypothetical protein DPMN_087049 [Dreissena polymorpha]|uniref:Uncharacterized protein n=1 Tax=Dreissena polymorpha TaxID=45954 RepID=A0A9D4QW08_DREPO|nr:hypothetical protein DPMN_087049 [Dreissena polymorpha]